ncbi:polysaccharide biosynthesis protein [Aliikangiella marina]|uniref:Polysaccharide biosynthesis protein n=1 Tax=Aliikangiella marina TaxID=1712262 RepID=A0A545TBI7_9GAMM|nr:polysaccharide biosynthesis protein [Aliikangiella marina]TQV74578.1 polysaccharide biosynthesis protein [Aliikangiella marina]
MSTLEKAYLKAMKISEDVEDHEKKQLIEEASEKLPLVTKKNSKDLADSRTGISQMEQAKNFTLKELQDKSLIYPGMKNSTLLDRYRTLRTKLLSLSRDQNFVTLVTSVVPESNSHLIAANLAATFALDEAKTSMLIESNIRYPHLNDIFEMRESRGMIDFLENEEWESGEVLYKTGIPRLRFVPSGLPRENSAEYFTTDKMSHFVRELVGRYPDRYPIINAPSIEDSADTRILIELCDMVVLVVPYGKCSDEEVMQACLAIGEDKLAGVVLDEF